MVEPWLEVEVAVKAQEAEGIVRLELKDRQGKVLPEFSAGAHIDVEVSPGLIRQYSLCNSPCERMRYEICVLLDNTSRGGSRAIHEMVCERHVLRIRAPRNHFALVPGASHHVLIAGGIGITPILAMAEQLSASGRLFEMHYCTRSKQRTAFLPRIRASAFSSSVQVYHDDGPLEQRFDPDLTLQSPQVLSHLYVCGPSSFINYVLQKARELNWSEESLHREFFSGGIVEAMLQEQEFEVELRRTRRVFSIPADKSIAQVLSDAGIDIAVSCEQGVCGTCLTRVLDGVPEHHDVFLTDAEHAQNDQMTVCCSRAKTHRLVLDL